jgi:hypothetical protein
VHTSYRVWSALVLTNWSNSLQVSCRSCGLKKQLADSAFSLALGWWGFPWGLIMTPIQVGRNLVRAARPPEISKPSAQLEKAIRISVAKQLATSAAAAQRTPS